MFNLDPKKMQAVMKQLGMQQEEIDAQRVIIERTDESRIIIEEPSVVKIEMQGQESFQVSGVIREEKTEKELFSEQDIKTVMEKTGTTKEQAISALEANNGDLAEAILELSE